VLRVLGERDNVNVDAGAVDFAELGDHLFDAFNLLRYGTGYVQDECDLNVTGCSSLVAFDSVFDRAAFDIFVFMFFACCDDALFS
jgi:hypothetical protein